jgi:hypothetical protein
MMMMMMMMMMTTMTTTTITATFDKTNEGILKELNTESYWIKFQNIKTTVFNMLTECRERSETTEQLQGTGEGI